MLSCAQLCLTLCGPMDYSLPGSSVHGIFQARILEWLSFPSLGDLPNPGIEPMSLEPPALARGFFTTWEAIGYIHISSCNLKKKMFLQPSLTRNIGLESVCIWTSHFLSLSLSFFLRKIKRQIKCIKDLKTHACYLSQKFYFYASYLRK